MPGKFHLNILKNKFERILINSLNMKNLPKEKPVTQPNPKTNPIQPRFPEIIPGVEKNEPTPVLPEIKPFIQPEMGNICENLS
jgi:hypothetical protein